MGIFDEVIKGVGSKILGGAGQGGLFEQVKGLINNPPSLLFAQSRPENYSFNLV